MGFKIELQQVGMDAFTGEGRMGVKSVGGV